MHVVAEHVAVQERAAAVRLHEQLDGGFFLRFAAEDLGDDAFHLAAIALIDQAAHTTATSASQPTISPAKRPSRRLHQFALGDRLRRRFCGTWPRESCWPSSAASCRRRWRTERYAAQVQPVIGDRQPVAARRLQQVGGRHAEVVEHDALVVRVLERVQAVLLEAESVRSLRSADRR